MPKLILSSCDFRNRKSAEVIFNCLPKAAKDCRVLFFPNEKATEAAILGGKYHARLAEFGFEPHNVTVFNYFSPQDLADAAFDVIYISGGNTFGTMKRLKEAGADRIVRNYVNQGAVYIGGSAGAHIASVSIEHVKKYDTDTFGLTDFKGLGLFYGVLICHYTDDRKDDLEALKNRSPYPVTALRDDEAIVIEY